MTTQNKIFTAIGIALLALGASDAQFLESWEKPNYRIVGSNADERAFTHHFDPWSPSNTLAKIERPALSFTNDFPRLDGATSMYPIYAAAAKAIYKTDDDGLRGLVKANTTPIAYRNLASAADTTDLIFVFAPSLGQRVMFETWKRDQDGRIEKESSSLVLTPIGLEAFVFFVNKDNTVTNLTTEQIKAIYKHEITDWTEVGGKGGRIHPFVRNSGSGSQTAMESFVMKGEEMAVPLGGTEIPTMIGILYSVGAYDNSKTALGYSFRFYAETLNTDGALKFISVDGIAPTIENIRSGAYPFISEIYAATTEKNLEKPNVRALIDWFKTEQGRKLVEDSGYVAPK